MLTDASTLSGLDIAFTAKVNAYEVMDYLDSLPAMSSGGSPGHQSTGCIDYLRNERLVAA